MLRLLNSKRIYIILITSRSLKTLNVENECLAIFESQLERRELLSDEVSLKFKFFSILVVNLNIRNRLSFPLEDSDCL